MVEFIDFPRNRKRSRGKSRYNHPAKRQRPHIPPAEYIPIDDNDGPTNATTIYQNNRAISQRSHDASQLRSNGRSSANSSKDPIQAEVNRLLAEYTRGIPPDLYASGKKKAYYIVWKGHQCGIFTTWTACQAQTNGVSKAGSEQAEHNLAPPEKPKEPPLCAEQQHAMDLAMQGHNVFITGSGGCGKSVLVKALYRAFSALLQGSGKTVNLIAPTGQAALNIEGRTTYNYAGWTPDDLKKPLYSHDPNTYSLIRKAQGKKIFKRYTGTQVLIIDEISMIENQFFERLSRVMSATRKDTRPFGGVQMIVVGDFCQLPPVDPFQWCMACGRGMRKIGASSVCPDGHGVEFEAEDKWAFKSPEWTRCNFKTVHLTKIHRQQDEAFIGVLQKCRLGRFLETDDVNLLLNHESETENATELKSTKEEVAKRNKQKFDQIPGKIREYQAIDAVECVQGETSQPPRNLDDHRYAQTLQLKANTPVVLLANIDLDRGLCNGRQGTVIGFVPGSEVRRPEPPNRGNFEHDDDAYRAAETRHSKIVSFLDRASASGEKFDLAKIFEHGQAYVALSRARSLRGLKIEGATAAQLRSTFRVDYAVEQFMETFEAADIEDNPAGAQEEDESSEEEEEVSEISQEEY
ncbi:ATP-dependent DNA helicase PIF1, partial [Colletotrichum gloeosporioides]